MVFKLTLKWWSSRGCSSLDGLDVLWWSEGTCEFVSALASLDFRSLLSVAFVIPRIVCYFRWYSLCRGKKQQQLKMSTCVFICLYGQLFQSIVESTFIGPPMSTVGHWLKLNSSVFSNEMISSLPLLNCFSYLVSFECFVILQHFIVMWRVEAHRWASIC